MPSTPVRHQPKLIHPSRPAPHVLLLTIARPPVNAFHTALWTELREAFDDVEEFSGEEEEVRCVVLAGGVDKGLTAGLDRSCPPPSPPLTSVQLAARKADVLWCPPCLQ